MNKRALWLSFGGLLAMAAGIGIGRFVYTPILPPMVEAVPLTKAQAGLIASANFVGYFAGALLAAIRLPGSRRVWLLASLAVTAICLLGMGLTTVMPAFIGLRLIAGAASAFALIFSSALVIDRLSATGQGALSAIHFAGVGVGIAVSALIVAVLLRAGAAWPTLWFASAAIAAAASLAVGWLVSPDEAPAQAAQTAVGVRLSADFAALLLSYGLFGFGYVITATFIVDMVRGSPTLAHLEPYIWVLFGLSAVPSVAVWTGLGRRWGVLPIYAVACAVEAIGVATSALWLHPASIVISAVFVGGTFMGLTALGLVATRSGSGDPRGRIALMTASFSFGQILGPAFAGYVYDASGSLATPLLVAVATLVLAAALSLVAEARRRAVSPST
ncbi:MAG: YbfB/YjiJ family MFS transporter [Reyranella sp.]|uniref:YbfB/YjiJ family MFS transporter n=1 Tax=Reyranella sp. TaxID=1929291 RepID=UPI001224B912|nr:YbfB/YjiJ family MFS transporter [Reyranella sp.]TAJ96248.1 MAG: YbfB/YjiJ family MFS transporter [Reyranella sp.]TBR29810.1 MAG: YbfB/YjiJ family MFS transporter [Reyranella sp.]